VFENRVLRRILGPSREEVVGAREDCVMRSFTKYYWDEQMKEGDNGPDT
jgi:hypothetical protein